VATTTIHVPDDLLRAIDRASSSLGISRNRFVLQACREALEREAGDWPEGFFDAALEQADAQLLVEASLELDREVRSQRRNRGAVAL